MGLIGIHNVLSPIIDKYSNLNMQSLFVIDSGKLAAAFEESFVMRAISD